MAFFYGIGFNPDREVTVEQIIIYFSIMITIICILFITLTIIAYVEFKKVKKYLNISYPNIVIGKDKKLKLTKLLLSGWNIVGKDDLSLKLERMLESKKKENMIFTIVD